MAIRHETVGVTADRLREIHEPVRLHLLAVKEGLDPRHRAFIRSAAGRRVQFERRLITTAATLVVRECEPTCADCVRTVIECEEAKRRINCG